MTRNAAVETAIPDGGRSGRIQRRPWWRGSAAIIVLLLALVAATAGGLAASSYRDALRSNVGELSFRNPLAIPPLAEATVDEVGRRVFDLTMGPGQSTFLQGRPADTWGVNGPYLGPTLRASAGDDVLVKVTNRLDELTTLHWHGMLLPATADGGPHQPIAPGATWSPAWTVDQPAATLWYHAHPEGHTGAHVYRGVAGMFIVDDPQADGGALPHRYGVDDIPLIVQDKRFTRGGSSTKEALASAPSAPSVTRSSSTERTIRFSR